MQANDSHSPLPSILLVDDRKDNLLVLRNLLKDCGASILCAGSGNEALALMLKHDFALVLLDIQMPSMDGFETAELMRSRDKTMHMPIVFITAFGHEQEMVFKGYEKGAVDYLFKPIDERILKSKVRVFLDLYEQRRKLEITAARLAKYAETQAILLREVNHRVKNNLASIISMLNIRRDHVPAQASAEYRGMILDLISCVRGLAAVHGLLSEKNWQPLDLGDLCRRIIQSALHDMPSNTRIAVDVQPSKERILPDQAHHLAFVLNELAINTRKHAIPARDHMQITVAITATENSTILLYRDNGPGYPAARLAKTAADSGSIGMELIEGIVRHNLGGEVRFANDEGATAEIVFKTGTSSSI